MGKKIAIWNESGSVGKTTTVVNLACALAKRGERVRVVGLDPQCDAEYYLGIGSTPRHTGDMLVERTVIGEDGERTKVLYTIAECEVPVGIRVANPHAEEYDPTAAEWLSRITVVPAGADLYDDQVALDQDPLGGTRLREAFEEAEQNGDEDKVITLFDCPGSKSVFTINVLYALDPKDGDRVVTCTPPDWKGTGGLGKMQKTLNEVNRRTRRTEKNLLDIDAVVPCRVPPSNRGKFFQNRLADLKQDDSPWAAKVAPRIREAVVVPESFWQQEPLLIYVPDEPVTADYLALLDWLDERGVTK
ncbi:hypothetical protein GCM10012275_61600 [Longimycelium tulufanense]|uniref:AAA domain-containing protein n=1 Tax=Longimycelium tulufanense TaxID=907463 RepID=A0A8J3CKI9_9PSEU|nr:AAA family ATPase [Longimycelium tulufanense]GGM82792.1 hypothetical protein GCM10012275_61600 [Longimycelium tulufanense]